MRSFNTYDYDSELEDESNYSFNQKFSVYEYNPINRHVLKNGFSNYYLINPIDQDPDNINPGINGFSHLWNPIRRS